MQIELSEERLAQLNEYARRHGQDMETALDEVLADALEYDRLESEEVVKGIQRGYEDMKAGRTRPASEVFDRLFEKYGIPR